MTLRRKENSNMIVNKLLRPVGVGVVAVTALAGIMIGAPAYAAVPTGTLGTVALIPASGSDVIAPKVHTSAGCPASADGYYASIYGPGAFAAGAIVTSTTDVGFSTSGGFDVQIGNSAKDVATDLGTTVVAGQYAYEVSCIDQFSGDVKGTFAGSFWFTSATAYQSTDPNAPVSTTTSLGIAPAAPVVQGTTVTLTATVTPAAATGTVQFFDGATPLGGPVTVASGSASLSTAALTAATHSLKAAFTPSGAPYTASESGVTSYQVTAPVATVTTTALAVTPSGTVTQYSPVSLSATVTPAGAVGAIQFLDGGVALGAPVAVSGGSASLSISSLGVGAHSLSARFVPTNPVNYAGSESDSVALAVTAFAGVSTSENISTTVVPGALVISVANANVVLPTPQLTPDATKLTTAGSLNPITVTDTRAGNVGWNVAGQVSDFTDGAAHGINGANLGWDPKVIDKFAVQTITAGPSIAPANAIAVGASAPAGLGLATSRTLATAAALAGVGTAHLGADVSLYVPTSTVAGTYSATLTLTAI
ncbi:Ig-like domain repeat protein [Catellatospora sp. TT07R-123]|uniref:Ig-like domain repeat protein n=1 Tax=Catellatospora sp. TT07R-123 TaxID=2733863 RepID=UPI001FD0D069|nr:Ig-like domain repeat protein [Catellatospora sp. TT07R-123]